MRAGILTVASVAFTTLVLGNAYYQKKQFYPSVVYITKSNPSMAVLYIQAFVMVILMSKLMGKIFFGQLRAAEMEHLIERSWYAVTETCLAFTVFRDDFSPRFVALFTLLLFLKCFHWLGEDRVDYMERSPLISLLFHLRVLALLSTLAGVDLYFINHAYYSTLVKGASVQLVFGFEYAILLTVIVATFVKYVLHTIDLQSENPWENKAVYLLYSELILGFVKVVLYMTFMAIMIKVHTFPLFAIRPMYLTMRNFKKALHDVIMSRRAINNMNTLYPDATAEELQTGDNVCIICREDMLTACKKLPCNHIFHASCLRSWFQRQQTCPTCRMDILRVAAPQVAPQPQQPNIPPPHPNFGGMFPGFGAGFPGAWPPPHAAPAPPGGWHPQQAVPPGAWPQQPAQGPSSSQGAPSTSEPQASTAVPSGGPDTMPQVPQASMMPPFMMPPPFMMAPPMPFVPPPLPDINYTGMTDVELRAMEGQERANVESRIQCLRNIQTLLDAAMVTMNQYTTVVSALSANANPTPSRSSSNTSSQPIISSPASPVDTVDSPEPTTENTAKDNIVDKSPIADTSDNKTDSLEQLDLSNLEGAVGYTAPKEEVIPEWDDPNNEEFEDERHVLRRRRLERFSGENESKPKSEDIALD